MIVYTRRMLSILGERELRLHSESHVLRCTVNDLCNRNQRLSTYSNTYIIPVQYTFWGSIYKCHNNKKLAFVMHLYTCILATWQ